MRDILDTEAEVPFSERIPATQTNRLVHHLIDTVLFAIGQQIISTVLLDIAGVTDPVTAILIALAVQITLYTLFEFHTGKTPGKFVTRTEVINIHGERPTFANLLGRSAARMIPFDAFSFLFMERGWHDSLSGTYVVKDVDPAYPG